MNVGEIIPHESIPNDEEAKNLTEEIHYFPYL